MKRIPQFHKRIDTNNNDCHHIPTIVELMLILKSYLCLITKYSPGQDTRTNKGCHMECLFLYNKSNQLSLLYTFVLLYRKLM